MTVQESGEESGYVALREPNGVAPLTTDGDLVPQQRNDGGVTFVIGDDELIHRFGPRAFSHRVSGV